MKFTNKTAPLAPTIPTMPVADKGEFVCVFDNAVQQGTVTPSAEIEQTSTVGVNGEHDELQTMVRVEQNKKYYADAVAYFRRKAVWGLARGWHPRGISEAIKTGKRYAGMQGLKRDYASAFTALIADHMVANEMEVSLRSDGLFIGIEMMIENGLLAVGAIDAPERVRLIFNHFEGQPVPIGYQFLGAVNTQQKTVFRAWFAQATFEELRERRHAFMARTKFHVAMSRIAEEMTDRGYYRGPLHRLRVWDGMPNQVIGTDRSMAQLCMLESGFQAMHGYLHQTEGQWILVNGTTNGAISVPVCGNWMPMPGRSSIPLDPRDIVMIGSTAFMVEKVE